MKTVGIIGGLGPETTAELYLEIVSGFARKGESKHPSILIYSVPLPLQVEKECIINAQNTEKCLPDLINAAQTLQKGGADFLVLACNSLHIFIDEIRKSIQIPVLSAIEETVKVLKRQNFKRVGVLATSITINNRLYTDQFNSNGIKDLILDKKDQDALNQIIYHLVTGQYNNEDKRELDNIIDNLSNKSVDSIILACTDLQLLKPHHDKIEIFDTMKILADAIFREMTV